MSFFVSCPTSKVTALFEPEWEFELETTIEDLRGFFDVCGGGLKEAGTGPVVFKPKQGRHYVLCGAIPLDRGTSASNSGVSSKDMSAKQRNEPAQTSTKGSEGTASHFVAAGPISSTTKPVDITPVASTNTGTSYQREEPSHKSNPKQHVNTTDAIQKNLTPRSTSPPAASRLSHSGSTRTASPSSTQTIAKRPYAQTEPKPQIIDPHPNEPKYGDEIKLPIRINNRHPVYFIIDPYHTIGEVKEILRDYYSLPSSVPIRIRPSTFTTKGSELVGSTGGNELNDDVTLKSLGVDTEHGLNVFYKFPLDTFDLDEDPLSGTGVTA